LKKKYRKNKANGEGKVEAPKDDFYQQELKAQAELDKRCVPWIPWLRRITVAAWWSRHG
jgi:hypothetical protein